MFDIPFFLEFLIFFLCYKYSMQVLNIIFKQFLYILKQTFGEKNDVNHKSLDKINVVFHLGLWTFPVERPPGIVMFFINFFLFSPRWLSLSLSLDKIFASPETTREMTKKFDPTPRQVMVSFEGEHAFANPSRLYVA